jgi:chromosome segregation ATPase
MTVNYKIALVLLLECLHLYASQENHPQRLYSVLRYGPSSAVRSSSGSVGRLRDAVGDFHGAAPALRGQRPAVQAHDLAQLREDVLARIQALEGRQAVRIQAVEGRQEMLIQTMRFYSAGEMQDLLCKSQEEVKDQLRVEFNERFEKIDAKHEDLAKKVKDLERKLFGLDAELNALSAFVSGLETRLKTCQGWIDDFDTLDDGLEMKFQVCRERLDRLDMIARNVDIIMLHLDKRTLSLEEGTDGAAVARNRQLNKFLTRFDQSLKSMNERVVRLEASKLKETESPLPGSRGAESMALPTALEHK